MSTLKGPLYYFIEKFLPHHSCRFLMLCIPEMRFNVKSLRRQRAQMLRKPSLPVGLEQSWKGNQCWQTFQNRSVGPDYTGPFNLRREFLLYSTCPGKSLECLKQDTIWQTENINGKQKQKQRDQLEGYFSRIVKR